MSDSSADMHRPAKGRLKIVRSGADTGGEVLELEATYGPRSARPPEHFHPRQDERFTILQGEFRASVGGVERTYRAGDTFEIPAGVPHWMHNVSDEEGRLNWQVRPALRTQELLQTFFAMADDAGAGTGGSRPALPFIRTTGRTIGRLIFLSGTLREFREEFRVTRPPAAVQWLLINTLGRFASRGTR